MSASGGGGMDGGDTDGSSSMAATEGANKLYVGMLIMLIFSEALALYGTFSSWNIGSRAKHMCTTSLLLCAGSFLIFIFVALDNPILVIYLVSLVLMGVMYFVWRDRL